ncbi:MAG: hypothetical protein KGI81_00285 [Betaproteobacteria bacterium]|nr:hypothetical protein [Betaproteobacteria bacterium]
MKKVTVRISDELHAEIEQAVKRTGQSFQKVVAGYLAKDNLVSLMATGAKTANADITDAVGRLDRRIDARLAIIEKKLLAPGSRLGEQSLAQNLLARATVLLLAQTLTQAAMGPDKQRIKFIADRVREDARDGPAHTQLMLEVGRFLRSDGQGDMWRQTLAAHAQKLSSGEG